MGYSYITRKGGGGAADNRFIVNASDNTKWTLTNLVNRTNTSGVITFKFDHWVPVSNTTSTNILDIPGAATPLRNFFNSDTVTGGIVNIASGFTVNAQITSSKNYIVRATNGAKFQYYNGYNYVSGVTPANWVLNRWMLNNSATGTLLSNNVVSFINTGNVIGNIVGRNYSTFANNFSITAPGINSTSNAIADMKEINGHIYAVTNQNYLFVFNSTTGAYIRNGFLTSGPSITNGYVIDVDEEFLYVTNNVLRKYRLNDYTLVASATQSQNLGSTWIYAYGNSVYIPGEAFRYLRKYNRTTFAHEGDIGTDYGGGQQILQVLFDDTYMYGVSRLIRRYWPNNMALTGLNSSGGERSYIAAAFSPSKSYIFAAGGTNARFTSITTSSLSASSEFGSFSGLPQRKLYLGKIAGCDAFLYSNQGSVATSGGTSLSTGSIGQSLITKDNGFYYSTANGITYADTFVPLRENIMTYRIDQVRED